MTKEKHCTTLPYFETRRFSKTVNDYLAGSDPLKKFYTYQPNIEGVKQAIAGRKQFPINRELLSAYFTRRYQNVTCSEMQHANLQRINNENCFTITTAHQPNIYTGPLYFLYKILHAIKLADYLKNELTDYDFVPVFYMGSEDADLDELGHFFVEGLKLEWKTDQQGAIGRMHTKGLTAFAEKLSQWFYDKPFIDEVLGIFKDAYSAGENVQEATFHFLQALFGRFGLLVLVPDDADLKRSFEGMVKRELLEQFSGKIVQQTNDALVEAGYSPQASGRELNLFYLNDEGRRERIELEGKTYTVPALGLAFNEQEILDELDTHPERFSGNVILRGLFQESILPNIVFIGGGGEIAYWLQLKDLFNDAAVFFPLLALRNSFALLPEKYAELQKKLGLGTTDIFLPDLEICDAIAERFSDKKIPDTIDLQNETAALYERALRQTADFDSSLIGHIAALHTDARKGLIKLNKKYKSLARRKAGEQIGQWKQLQHVLFPNGGLQERTENFIPFYAAYGPELLDMIYDYSQPFAQSFSILQLPEKY